MLPAEAVDLGQQGRHAPQDVVALEAIVLQIGQQGQHVHGHAFAAAGQHLARFTLVVLDGLELVDLGLTEPGRFAPGGPAATRSGHGSRARSAAPVPTRP